MKKTLAGAFAAALMLSAAQPALAVERGGTLVYGRYADSLFLDPVLNDANVDIWVLSNLYDTLLLPTDNGQGVQPGLATKWNVSADGMSVTLQLRKGAKFSNGRDITPEDVIWSLERAANPKNGIWNFLISSIDKVVTDGTDGVKIMLKHPDPAILHALTVFNTAVMPEKEFEAEPGKTDEAKAREFAKDPIGSGPFVLKSWVHGQSMTLVRNPYFWAEGSDGKPLPYLNSVVFKVIPDDATRILQLQSGALDGAEFIPYARVQELKKAPDINMELYPSTRVEYVTMNVRKDVAGKANPLSNPEVRQALNYATNKKAIIQIVTHGVGSPMSSFMSSATPLHAGKGELYPYDLAKAKALMAKAGYGKGFSTSLLVLAGNQDELSIATMLQQMWGQVGVKLQLQQVDNATRTDEYRKGEFSMRLSAWTDDIADPSEITSYFAYSPTIQSLHTGWKNDTVDKLFVESQSQMDAAKRKEEYAKIQQIFNTTGPTVSLYQTPYPVALRKDVHGFVQIPLGNNIFRAAWVSKKTSN